jgi:hypothetical protein
MAPPEPLRIGRSADPDRIGTADDVLASRQPDDSPITTGEVVVSAVARLSRSDRQDRSVGARALTALAARTAIVAVAAGLAVALVAAHVAPSALASTDVGAQPLASPELARAFTDALNAHDVDALVDMFGDAEAGPTVQAERYAWNRYEIRLWAQLQARANIRVDAYDYQATEHGATWSATVHRDDWQAAGVEGLAQTHSIWVEDGKIVALTATLTDPRDAGRLGHLWRPGASPDRFDGWDLGD